MILNFSALNFADDFFEIFFWQLKSIICFAAIFMRQYRETRSVFFRFNIICSDRMLVRFDIVEAKNSLKSSILVTYLLIVQDSLHLLCSRDLLDLQFYT